MPESTIKIYPDANSLAEAAARLIVAKCSETLVDREFFTIALSGGSTPKHLYELLADAHREFHKQIDWASSHFFWTDERFVAPDHPESNFRMANEAMLSKVPVPKVNIHRVITENSNPEKTAENYARDIRSFFKTQTVPSFDLVLLGMGTDGHTASLFPETNALNETDKLVTAVWIKKFDTFRITLTLPVLTHAKNIVFLVSGGDKAAIVDEVLNKKADYPARRVQPVDGELIWMIDDAAAGAV